jgi:hypothetical protein
LKKAERHLKNKAIIRCFEALHAAFQQHQKAEAGSIKRITTLALDFIDTFIVSNKLITTADETVIQSEWIKNIMLPIKGSTKINGKK